MTKALFIDLKKVKVEASNGDVCFISFMDSINYQINEQTNNSFLNFLEDLFEKRYDGELDTIWRFNLYLTKKGFNSIFSIQLNRDKERERIGNRIKQLREEKNISAKTLAVESGIDAANLCRIEQGKYSAGFDILTKIANVFNCEIDFVKKS